MTRSKWKGFFCDPILIKKVYYVIKYDLIKKVIINVWSRSSTILPFFSGLTFRIHNGKKFSYLTVKEENFFCKFGEFAYPKRIGNKIHSNNKLNKKKLKKKA